MLTDEQIEKLIYPYAKRQAEFSLFVIRTIAKRLSKITDFDDLSTLNKTLLITEEVALLKRAYQNYVAEQKKHLKEDFWWIALVIYLESAKFYQEQVELELNKKLMAVINAETELAQTQLAQLLRSPVIVLRDLKNPAILKPYNFEQAYKTILDEALAYSNVSNDLRDIALKRTETQLFDSGVRYMINNSSNDAKDTTNATTAIRNDVLESIKSLINEMQDVMGEQFGADAVELSAHMFPAPDHEQAQGHQFSLEEVEKIQSGQDFTDLQGRTYAGFERNIGAWNCRHYFMQIKSGTEPIYTQEELDNILKENEKGYTDENGNHRTLYECTQVQRRYEREIRKAKEKYLYGKALNDKGMMANARNRARILTTKYKQFSANCDIPIQPDRISVKDYN